MRVVFFVKSIADACFSVAIADEMRRRTPSAVFAAVAFREALEGRRLRESGRFVEVITESELHAGKGEALAVTTNGAAGYWRAAMYDRFVSMHRLGFVFRPGSIYSREQIRAVLHRKRSGIHGLVEGFSPDLVLFPGIDMGPVSALLLATAAAEAGVPVRRATLTRLGDRVYLSESERDESVRIRTRFQDLRKDAPSIGARSVARDLVDRLRGGHVTAPAPLASPRKPKELLTGLVRAAQRELRPDPLSATLIGRAVDRIQIWARGRMAATLFRPLGELPFVFFPMHLEPEMALLLSAPFWCDQLSLIYNVAQSLPEDTELWVKDHPHGIGRRPLGEYRRIAGIPNVRLIDPRVPSLELIKKCQGVVTISGTAALEAFVCGKPAITFGDVYFNDAQPGITQLKNPELLPKALAAFRTFVADEHLLETYVCAVLDNSIDMNVLVVADSIMRGADLTEPVARYVDFILASLSTAGSAPMAPP